MQICVMNSNRICDCPFLFYGCSMVRIVPFRFCTSTIADSAIIGFHKEGVIFDMSYFRLEASYRHGIKSDVELRLMDIHIQESRKTSLEHDSSKRYKLVGLGLATMDRLPTVSLVLEQLQTWDKDCHIERV